MRQPEYLLLLARVTGATRTRCINCIGAGGFMEDMRRWGGRQDDQFQGRPADGRMSGDTTRTTYR